MVVIGAGAAGLVAAGMAALLGAKTALVEKHRLGGDCTWMGCVPSKTLLKTAKVAHDMRNAQRFGLASFPPVISFERVMDHVRSVRKQVYDDADAPPYMEKLGVEVIEAGARFLDPSAIEIREASGQTRRITSRFFCIATGSRPKMPRFSVTPLTNETLFELTSQPKELLVIGGGPIGIEMAQAFQRLGSTVTVVTSDTRILVKDDSGHAEILREALASEGVSFIFERQVRALDRRPTGLIATLDDGQTILCDAALAATGREPTVEGLDLDNAGVKLGKKGIEIDRHCRTSRRNIYATGDVTGRYEFTHIAEHMSKVAVTNAILRWPRSLDEKHIVWCTYTHPELARLGESEADVRKRGSQCSVFRLPFSKLDRAITEGETAGEVKVITDRSGRILGASIVGVNAGEMISEYALAMRNGLRIAQIADTIHPYPTYLLGNRLTADQWYTRQLDSPLLGLLARVFGYRGLRKGASVL